MWKCENCGLVITINVKEPIRCDCLIVKQESVIPEKINKFSELWKKLHEYKFISPEEAEIFLKEWEKLIPSNGCSCKNKWKTLVKKYPPDFSSAYNFFLWGFNIHNMVNELLNKPQMSLEEAKKVYNIISSS